MCIVQSSKKIPEASLEQLLKGMIGSLVGVLSRSFRQSPQVCDSFRRWKIMHVKNQHDIVHFSGSVCHKAPKEGNTPDHHPFLIPTGHVANGPHCFLSDKSARKGNTFYVFFPCRFPDLTCACGTVTPSLFNTQTRASHV